MLDFIITLWSMSMFSLYLAFDSINIYILLNILMIYTFNAFIVAYRIYKWWKDLKKAEGSERTSFLLWIIVWCFVVLMFFMKDVNLLTDIGIISAVWLFFVLLTTLMTSCYVIMKDSKAWTNQIFNVCVLHWVLTHKSKEWLMSTPLMLCIPIVCVFIIRVANHIETKSDPRKITFEMLVWIVIFAIELAYDLNLLDTTIFYICVFLLVYALVAMHIGVKLTLITLFSFIITPMIIFITLCKIKKYGWVEGMSDTWIYIEKKWKGHSIETDENLKSIREIDNTVL